VIAEKTPNLTADANAHHYRLVIGWDLGAFFESEALALSEYGVEFLQVLCTRVGIDWIAALP
jgi:hypothetical protein